MAKSKIKVPKRVAGVKIPKSVRKGPVVDFVNSTAGRALIAQALTAAIGVFAYKNASPETREQVSGKIKDGAAGARDAVERNTARLSYAFGEAVTAFRTALAMPDVPESAPQSTEETPAGAGGKKKKKESWSSSEVASPH
jgi:hypothetical protein